MIALLYLFPFHICRAIGLRQVNQARPYVSYKYIYIATLLQNKHEILMWSLVRRVDALSPACYDPHHRHYVVRGLHVCWRVPLSLVSPST